MHNRNVLHDSIRSPWGSAWHLQPEAAGEPSGPASTGTIPVSPPMFTDPDPTGPMVIEPHLLAEPLAPTTEMPVDDPVYFGRPVSVDPAPTDPMPADPVPPGIPIGPPIQINPEPSGSFPGEPALPAAPQPQPEPTGDGKDLERWFWTESEALADLRTKPRLRIRRFLGKS